MAEILWLQHGNYRAVDDFERVMTGMIFQFDRLHKAGSIHPETKKVIEKDEIVKYAYGGGLREFKIMGFAIPDNKVNEVLNGLNVGDGEVHPFQATVAVTALRKLMGADKIPPEKERGQLTRIIPREGVAVYPIGVKKDKTSTWATGDGQVFTQENM